MAPETPPATDASHPTWPRWERALASVGQGVEAIDTPALVIDLDAMERNLDRMARFASKHQLRLRPHAKMHKSAELAQLQMAHGAVGVCVQKTDEALALAHAGVTDVYISNEVIAPPKLARLAAAVRDLPTRFAIAVDSLAGVQALAQALDRAGVDLALAMEVFIEIDIGSGRCGVPPGPAAVALATAIAASPCLRFAGLQAYNGSAQHLRRPHERAWAIGQGSHRVRETAQLLEAAGFPVPLVTGAGTGSFVLEAASGVWGELQTGSYLFMDTDYAANERDERAPAFEHALFVKSQVISRSADHAVCDAGHKSHAIDSGLPTVWHPGGLVFANGGDEHGLLRAASATSLLPDLGATVWLVPGHCDPTVNLHDYYVGVRGGLDAGQVERVIRIDARGAVG